MSNIDTEANKAEPHLCQRRRLRQALIFGTTPVEAGHVADRVANVVEFYVRARFNLTAAQYDLDFTDPARAVERLLTAQLDDVIDIDDAVEAIASAIEEEKRARS